VSETGHFLVGAVVGVAIALGVAIGVGRRLRRREFAGTGYGDRTAVARRLRSALLVVGALEVVVTLVTLVADEPHWWSWTNLALGIWLTALAAALPRQRRRQVARLHRSAELNEALARSCAGDRRLKRRLNPSSGSRRARQLATRRAA
jgi:hypothetical protein